MSAQESVGVLACRLRGRAVKLMTITQLAEMIGVKPKTIYDWTHRGEIPCVKLGRLLRFDQDEIERWVKSKKRERALN